MRKWVLRLTLLAAVLALILLLRFTVFAPDPVPVRVVEVGSGRVESTVTNSRAGSVRARRRAKLSPELGGQVVEIPYREGETVRAGQVLLRIDPSTYRARLDLAQRELETARAEQQRACLAAERAARELARIERLAEEGIVSPDLLDEVESGKRAADAACQAAAAAAKRAQAGVDGARTELEKTVLRAPFDGVVAEVEVEVGEWTTPSPPALPVPPVVDILDPSTIYVSAPMDEVDSALIQSGQGVRISVDSHRDQTFAGTVLRVAPYVLDLQEQNRTVEIEVAFEDSAFAQTLLPGTSADVEVILEVKEDVLRIPTSALMEGERVLLLEKGLLEERKLEVGLRNWNYSEIVSGLSGGELLVVSLDRPEVVAGAEAEAVEELP